MLIGTFKFKAIGSTGTTAPITFDTTSEVKDGEGKTIAGYVFNNAQVSIGAQVCPVVGEAECSWNSTTGATSYHVKITKVGQAEPIFDDDTTETKVTFDADPGATYTCEVFAENNCGTGAKDSTTVNCALPSLTPTLTLTPTTSPTSSPTPTKSPTPTLTPTSSPTPTPTTPVSTATPTPTTPPGSTATPTPTTPEVAVVTATPTPAEIAVVTSTPIPTLPPTGGSLATIGALFAGALVVIGGLLLFIL